MTTCVVSFAQCQLTVFLNRNQCRNLPQIGHKGWQSHFEEAFNAYTRLWRFQQQYRHILDSKYDLKRWQIGEIASKIGQLYYHY